jgi:predicted transcriptional regulator
MSDIIIFNHSLPEIGYVARTTTKGDEFDMVSQYIEYTVKKYEPLKKKKAAIFIEPQIDTGYPDIVIVEYLDPFDGLWDGNRNKLSAIDLKILFQIQTQRNVSINNLSEMLGFSSAEIKRSIHRLSKCGLIYLSKTQEHVRNVRLHSYCHINKIIAIEAKIDKWSEAIRQAAKNIWFSTESFILMNKDNCNDVIIQKCKEQGVGIILVNGKVKKILDSEHRKFPVSYTSIQFNEWIQRYEHRMEE